MAETIAAPMFDQHKLVEFHPPYPAPRCTQYRRWMERRAPTPIFFAILMLLFVAAGATTITISVTSWRSLDLVHLIIPLACAAAAVVGLTLTGTDLLRQRLLPGDYRGLAGEIRASVETRPGQFRIAHIVIEVAACGFWSAMGAWRLTARLSSAALTSNFRTVAFMSFALAAAYLIRAAMDYYGSRYLKELPAVSPLGYPPGWYRDMHAYLRWWDGYKWTLAFAPGEAERSRSGPPEIAALPKS